MSPVVVFAFLTAALSAVVGWTLYRREYAYPSLKGNTSEIKKSSKTVKIAGFAVAVAVAVEVVLAGWFVPVTESTKPLLYIAAAIAVGSMLGGLVVGHWRGKRKLTVN